MSALRHTAGLVCLAVLAGCATPAVQKQTGQRTDPPLGLLLGCLLLPNDPQCRGLTR